MHLRFAADIDLMSSSNGELQDLTNRLVDIARANGMKVSTENSKVKTNSTNYISADISMKGQKLEKVTSFDYFGARPVQGLLSRNPYKDCLSNGSSS